jgi:DNA (cytosine-5)-methyltransferase 1
MSAYYNEIDEKAAAWLRELIKAGLIADGEVDTRSIVDVRPGDLRGFRQCHFFAGIGGWSYALRLAGWPDDRPVWTGSCPCQPFSSAGKGRGTEDARHLWPQFRRLIRQCRPSIVFGEQVASKAGRVWLSAVFADAEALAYRAAGADLCAAGVGAPHIRQRLYFVLADSGCQRCHGESVCLCIGEPRSALSQIAGSGEAGELADTLRATREWRARSVSGAQAASDSARELNGREPDRLADGGEAGDMGHADHAGSQGRIERWDGADQCAPRPASVVSVWSDCDWIPCRDGKARPVEPGSFPLAHGIPARVGRLRGYGNAIVPQVAAVFIAAADECL